MTEAHGKPGDIAVVWGGLGFLGWHLIPKLIGHGVRVRVLCRNQRGYPAPPWADQVEWYEAGDDHSKVAQFSAAVAGAAYVFDFAGSSGAAASNRDPLESLDQNLREHLLFLQACEKAGNCPHIVFASSWLVYGRADFLPVDERHPLRPCSVYGAHKACIENYLRIHAERGAISYCSARLTNPYGFDPNPRKASYKILNAFLLHALDGQPICLFGDGSQLRDFLYAPDAAELLWRCAKSPAARNRIVNVGAGRSHSMREAVEAVQAMVPGARVEYRPWPREFELVEPGSYRADIRLSEQLLGPFESMGLEAGLRSTIEAFEASREAASACLPAI